MATWLDDDHPEELLDRVRTGQLDDADRLVLRAHIASCTPCAVQYRFYERTAAQSPQSSAHLSLDRMAVNRAFRELNANSEARPSSLRAWLLAGGFTLLLLSGTALAGTWWSNQHPDRGARSIQVQPGSSAARASASVAPVQPPSITPEAPPAVPAPPAPQPYREPSRVDQPSATELFERARKLRLSGAASAALAAYQQLQRLHPDSRESQLSYLLAGRIWLSRGRADSAVRQFELYLKTDGSAWEEALVGHATALDQLGRRDEAVTDWERLLVKRPTSVYAKQARDRLRETHGVAAPTHVGTATP